MVTQKLTRSLTGRLTNALTGTDGVTINPFIHLDASDTSSISESSGSVSTWLDKSGNGFHATQGTGSLQPTTNSSTQNGLNVLDFDGGDSLTLPSGTYTLANGNNTVFCVCFTSVTNSLQVVFGMAEAGTTRLDMRYTATVGQVGYQSRTVQTGGVTKSGVTDTTFGVIVGRRSGVTQGVNYDGGTESTNSGGLDEPGIDAASVGAFNEGTGFFLTGSIAELMVFNTDLTTSQIADILDMLIDKWGI